MKPKVLYRVHKKLISDHDLGQFYSERTLTSYVVLCYLKSLYRRLYRMSQDARSFWEVIVSVILSKEVYMYMCPIPRGFRDRAVSLYTVQTSNTPCPHTSCKVH
jgi:hypothetical protein